MSRPSKTVGPIVDAGPTAGQVRSRTKSGRWREKREDEGKPRSKGEDVTVEAEDE